MQVSTNLQFVCEEAPCSDVLTIAFIRYLKYIFFANNSRRGNNLMLKFSDLKK